MNIETVTEKIANYLGDRFDIDFDEEDFDFDSDLFEFGYVDSLDSLVIINYLEKTFNISISPEDLIDNPINSINQMAIFIAKEKDF